MIKSFENYNKDLKDGSYFFNSTRTEIEAGHSHEMHIKWCKKYQLLNKFTFDTYYNRSTNETTWKYSHTINGADILLEIRNGKGWAINFDFEKKLLREHTHKTINKEGLSKATLHKILDATFSFIYKHI